ncbi:MAG: LCP family protein, partial [Pseudonocardiaceae bacterium]
MSALAYGAYRYLRSEWRTVDIGAAATRPPAHQSPPPGTGKPINLLILGTDSERPAVAHDASRSDTTMLLHLHAGATKATVVSIPRDTLVTRPSCPTRDGTSPPVQRTMFNQAYAIGGVVCAVKTFETLAPV